MQEAEQNTGFLSAWRARTVRRLATTWQRGRQVVGLLRLKSFDTSSADGRSLERYRRIVLTTVSGMTVRVVGSLLGLVTVPLVLGYLGKERFGLWAIISTLVAWIALFDLGMANGLVNMLSAAHGRGEQEEAGRSLSTAFVALLAIATVLAIIMLLTIGHIPWGALLGAKGAADEATIRWSVSAAFALFVMSLPFSVTQQVYAAYQRTYLWNGFALLGSILSFAGLLLSIRFAVNMPMLIFASSVGGLVATMAAYGYATWRALPWLRPSLSKVSKTALRSLLSLSVPIFLFQIGALVVNETQSILLAHRCDLATVAAYSIGMRLYLLCIAVVQIGTNSFIPALREAYERGDRDWTTRAFARLLRVRLAIAACSGLVFVLLGNTLLALWLRRTDIAFGKGVWIAMALLMIGAMWGTSYAELLSIMDRLWLNVAAVFSNGAVTLVLTYYLSARYQVLGAVAALALPTALVAIVLRIFGRRFLATSGQTGAAARGEIGETSAPAPRA
jgi:O-antigen/teichoic acid export membrane protein